jgi:hypothetical protein
LRSIPVPERVDVGLRLIKEGGPTAYANSVSAVSIITVVTVDDVLFPFDKGEPALPPAGGVVMYMSSWTVPFHTALTSKPTVVRSSGETEAALGS